MVDRSPAEQVEHGLRHAHSQEATEVTEKLGWGDVFGKTDAKGSYNDARQFARPCTCSVDL